MWSICKKELQHFLGNLTGIVTITVFLVVNGVLLFVLPDNIFDFGYANLDKFFEFSPWVLVFLLPAISMRSISEELKTGTFEILSTRPLSSLQIILGKYFSILLILLLVLLSTVTYIITVKSLSSTGNLDAGGLTGSYLGLFFLGSVFGAISLCCSGLTQNMVVAFLVSALACSVLYFGFNAVSQLPALQGNADYYIEMIGIDFHYRSISRGVLDSRDMIYFLSMIVLFLTVTIKSLHKN